MTDASHRIGIDAITHYKDCELVLAQYPYHLDNERERALSLELMNAAVSASLVVWRREELASLLSKPD
jgi:hypothetical protein